MRDPHAVASQLIAEAPDEAWLRTLIEALHRRFHARPLERLLLSWQLSAAEAASLFGVSRQAFSRWLKGGPPTSRLPAIADLDAATAILERYLERDRIPAVVRRPAPFTNHRSLLEIAQGGDHAAVRTYAEQMFDLRHVQP